MKGPDLVDNAAIAELLAREAEQASGPVRQAFRRAARKAFLWEHETYDLLAAGKPLTELEGIGPFLARQIQEWFEKPPPGISPPEIRQEFLTLTRARRVLAGHPEIVRALKGDLHTHTCWSDGTGTVAEMATAAKDRGYRYLAITDHTKALKIARGLSEVRLFDQGKEIQAVNAVLAEKRIDLLILRSAEVNLSPLGQADLAPAALLSLDLVTGSFHSALRRTEDQTERYLAALRNNTIHILGHPQGRIFNHREGLKADWPKVFAEAARLDKAFEIDGYPDRQDLRLTLLNSALKERYPNFVGYGRSSSLATGFHGGCSRSCRARGI
jgi:histidinol phosphatase-like PHP family hydrolase